MTHAIRVSAVGGPGVLNWEEIEVGAPGPEQVRLKQTAVGLNYIDVYHRTGLYPLPLPFTPGFEGAGVVDAIGAGATHLQPGDRSPTPARSAATPRFD
jgi:NADPH:quinone reductase